MKMDICENTLYLVGYDAELSASMKMLLETQSFNVMAISDTTHFISNVCPVETDVIFLELNEKNPNIFKLFNRLVGHHINFKIIVTANQGSNFKSSDVFSDRKYDILLHPINLHNLLRSISALQNTAFTP